jgi:hypothetical protein
MKLVSSRARTFWLHFNRLNARRGAPDIWTVHLSDRCIQTKYVDCRARISTIYKGDTAPQPRAYFRGKGRIWVGKNQVLIVP